MSNVFVKQRVNRLNDDVVRFKNAVCAYAMTDAARYPENFESIGLEMAMKAEALACSTRNIVGLYPAGARKKVLQAAADAQGIRVSKINTGFEIVMPGLMPKRSGRNNATFIIEPLCFALEEFSNTNIIERYDHAMIWFIYEYGEDTPARHIRDYDNLEAKEVLDVINTFFLIDDSGEHCELHYSTRRGLKDCTRIIISEDIGLFSCPKKEKI